MINRYVKAMGMALITIISTLITTVNAEEVEIDPGVTGEVMELVADYPDDSWKRIYHFQPDDRGMDIQLHPDTIKRLNLKPKDRIRVKGYFQRLDKDRGVSTTSLDNTTLDNQSLQSTSALKEPDSDLIIEVLPQTEKTESLSSSPASGPKLLKPLILALDFTDLKGSQRFPYADVENDMYTAVGSVDTIYRQGTFNHVAWMEDPDGDGTRTDYFIINLNYNASDSCAYTRWASDARTAAKSQGIDVDNYDNVIYMLQRGNGCSWGGLAYVACTTCDAWLINRDIGSLGHELGHNLGLMHASTDPENDGVINQEYGDHGSMMAGPNTNQLLNIVNRSYLKWWGDYDHLLPVITESGQFSLQAEHTPIEESNGNFMGLKILVPGTTDKYYWVGYQIRRPETNPRGHFNKQLKVYRANGRGSARLATIEASGSWVDPVSGVTVSLNTAGATDALVTVDFVDIPIKLEAESADLSGEAQIYDDTAASGGRGVAYLSSPGSKISFSGLTSADTLNVTYASEVSGTMSVFINDEKIGELNFSNTGSWVGNYANVEMPIELPEGSSLSIGYENGDAAMNIDSISLSGEFELDTDSDTDTTTDTGTHTETGTDTDSGSDTDTDTGTDTDSGSDTDTDTDSDSETDTDTDTGSSAFGIEYISDITGIIYHEDNGWSAGFVYLCWNFNCMVPEKNNGRYELRIANFNLGDNYSIEFKVQDNASGQCLSGVQNLVYQNGKMNVPSQCD